MLRAVVERAGLIDHVRQVARMAGRKAVVPALLQVQQFIKWISIGHPGRSFLFSAEQITRAVKGERDRESHSGAEDLPGTKVRGDLHDGPSLVRQRVMRSAALVEKIGRRVAGRANAKIDRVVSRIDGHAYGIHSV